LLKIPHDYNDSQYVDDEGRIILIKPDKYKSEQVELVEGMHILVDGDDSQEEAVLELVEVVTSDGWVDTWRACILPGTLRYADEDGSMGGTYSAIRIEDMYAFRTSGPGEKVEWMVPRGEFKSRWAMYLYLRTRLNIPPDKIEMKLKEADLA
jgi:hypothetical protein